MTITISIDFETLGHNPSRNPAIALGAAAYAANGDLLNVFNRNITHYGEPNLDTVQWWAKFPEAYATVTKNQLPVASVMRDFRDYVVAHSTLNDVVFLAYNASYDMSFLTHLVYTHTPDWKRPPLYCVELRDVITQNVTLNRKTSAKRHWHPSLTEGFDVDDSLAHTPLYDAMIQAHVYFKVRRDEG